MRPQGSSEVKAQFFLFTASASPTTSEDEELGALAHLYNHNRIRPPGENVNAAIYFMASFLDSVIEVCLFRVR